jgi:phage anti-repressor protein
MTDFNLSHAQQFLQSSEQFPIDFDQAWEWLEYSTKGNAKRSFLNAGFIEGIDFCSFILNDKREIGATQVEVIKLTCECFKQWGMLSGTEKGRQIRLYFLECEKVAKQASSMSVEVLQALRDVQAKLVQQETNMALLTERTQRLNELEQQQLQFDAAAQLHPGCADILADQIDADIEVIEMSTKEWLDHLGLDYKYLNTIAKRASTFQKCGKKTKAVRKNKRGHVLIEIKYLRQATKLTLGL